MKKVLSKVAAAGLASMLVLSTASIASASTAKLPTVVQSAGAFNGVFTQFFNTTVYDSNVDAWTQEGLWSLTRTAEYEDGLAYFKEPEVKTDANGKVTTVYTYKLKDNMKFSDGKPVTADDIIFTYKVYLDPKYDGSGTLYTVPIQGALEYKYDDPNYSAKVEEIAKKSAAITDDQIKEYAYAQSEIAVEKAGVDAAATKLGYKNEKNLKGDELRTNVIQAHMDNEIATKGIASFKTGAVNYWKVKLTDEYTTANLKGGAKVPEISGIKKIDSKTVQITLNGVDPRAIYNLTIAPRPMHYYGVSADGKKKFTKGDLSVVKARTGAPMGAGPYIFKSYANNVVSYVPNPTYYKGAPKFNYKYTVVALGNELDGLFRGDYDITDPSASKEKVKQIEDNKYFYTLIDNNGYGYVGINAARVTDINVRKGLLYLMDRKPAVEAYYGNLASVVERPISKVSWAYPTEAKEFYGFNPEKSLASFKAAGYVQTQEGGKNVLKKDGVQLKYEFLFPGGDTQDHPVAGLVQKMKLELEKIGGVLEIRSLDSATFFDTTNQQKADIYAMAWQSTPDPDMYQVYHSKGPSNRLNIKNAELDSLIEKARQTTVQADRKVMYARALDIIMEEAVEMPFYQRKNMVVFNPQVIDVTTLAKNPTPYYGNLAEIENVRTVK